MLHLGQIGMHFMNKLSESKKERVKTPVYRNEDREKMEEMCHNLLFMWVILKMQVDCCMKNPAEGSFRFKFGRGY